MRDAPLKDRFNTLFLLASNRHLFIAEVFDFERNIWCPIFRCNLFYWEVEEMVSLLSVLEELKPDTFKRDSWEWIINSKGNFIAKSLYRKLVNQPSEYFPHKFIWIPGIPYKISFFIWNTYLDKILTLDHLQAEVGIWLTCVCYIGKRRNQ